MFLLHLADTSEVSDVGNTEDPTYSPIYIELDSTNIEPIPSPWIRCFLSLPAGYVCNIGEDGDSGGAIVRFEGTTAGLWELTTDNPVVVQNPTATNEIRLTVEGNNPTSFWIRGRTTYGEVPVDDRSTALRVSGQVEEV